MNIDYKITEQHLKPFSHAKCRRKIPRVRKKRGVEAAVCENLHR
jgi:hypothetical protein